MNTEIKMRLVWNEDEDLSHALAHALMTIRNAGFRTLAPIVRSSDAGSFLVATLVWTGEADMRDAAEALLRETLAAE